MCRSMQPNQIELDRTIQIQTWMKNNTIDLDRIFSSSNFIAFHWIALCTYIVFNICGLQTCQNKLPN